MKGDNVCWSVGRPMWLDPLARTLQATAPINRTKSRSTKKERRNEGNVLINETLNTFWFGHVAKDHSDRER